jgi:hypothetical protein
MWSGGGRGPRRAERRRRRARYEWASRQAGWANRFGLTAAGDEAAVRRRGTRGGGGNRCWSNGRSRAGWRSGRQGGRGRLMSGDVGGAGDDRCIGRSGRDGRGRCRRRCGRDDRGSRRRGRDDRGGRRRGGDGRGRSGGIGSDARDGRSRWLLTLCGGQRRVRCRRRGDSGWRRGWCRRFGDVT